MISDIISHSHKTDDNENNICLCGSLVTPASVLTYGRLLLGIPSGGVFYSDYLPSVEKSHRFAIVVGLDYFKTL